MIETFYIETERTILRNLTSTDAEDFYLLNLDPDVLKYTGDQPFKNIESAKKFLDEYDQFEKYGVGRLAVIDKKSLKFIGWCGLKYDQDKDEFDIGFRFYKKYWNIGFATETARKCIDFGFNKLGIQRIVGRAMKENIGSIKVLEKIGMIFKEDFNFENQEGVIFEIKNEREFENLIEKVKQIPYGRNANRHDFSLVVSENKGTCSSKHALLKDFANNNNIPNVKLYIGIFKMNEENTSKIFPLLSENQVNFIPEAHCYLKINGIPLDVTTSESFYNKIENDILEEIEIEPIQVAEYKVNYHKEYLKNWIIETNQNKTFEEIWAIRENCIQKLSK
ncbi:GNAT family N-acetyltransferase [Flavobacterium facile]|uniref:GNAT family N-acetyltransferase n=1 Tax=Flavobacterium facile TaxID=2893174 RepID=UPI002E7A1AF6|nr:GNAT family N-acetyltransferase [Flavobacterium sp. T-12]